MRTRFLSGKVMGKSPLGRMKRNGMVIRINMHLK
jgi:hypothetical protein